MQQWQYLTRFIYADLNNEGAMEYMRENYPQWRIPPKHIPQIMETTLDELGEAGWEVVHMQPVAGVNRSHEAGFASGGASRNWTWSHAYFCVFKRPRPDEE